MSTITPEPAAASLLDPVRAGRIEIVTEIARTVCRYDKPAVRREPGTTNKLTRGKNQ